MSRKQKSQENVGDAITEKLEQWRQENPRATLTEIEEAVEAELGKMRKQLVERMVAGSEETGEEVPDCAQCGQKMVKNGQKKRKLKGKEGETVTFRRQQWRCLGCGATFFPPG